MENFNKEDKEYSKAISALKSLKKISAKPNFEADLMRKINAEKYATKESIFQKYFWGKILISSAAAVVFLIVMFLSLPSTNDVMTDPFSEAPKVREDVIISKQNDILSGEVAKEENNSQKNEIVTPRKPVEIDVAEKKTDKSILDESFTLKNKKETAGITEEAAPALFYKATAIPDSEKKKLDSLKNRIFKDTLK